MLDDMMFMDQQLENQSAKIGKINQQVIDFSKNLMKVAQSYKEVGSAGRLWLNSMNMQHILKAQEKSLNKHSGMFLKTYDSLSNSMIALGSNINKLGTGNFSDITSDLKMLDEYLINISETINNTINGTAKDSMKQQLSLLVDQRNMMYDMNKLQVLSNQQLQKQFKHIDRVAEKMDKMKKGGQSFFEFLQNFGFRIPGFTEKFFEAFDFEKISDNLKRVISQGFMNKAMSKQQKGNGIYSSIMNNVDDLLNTLGDEYVFDQIKKSKEESLQMSSITDSIKDSFTQINNTAEKSFNDIGTMVTGTFKKSSGGITKIFGGLFKGLIKGFTIAFKAIAVIIKGILISSVVGIILVIGAMLAAGLKRNAQKQKELWDAQDAADALSGDGTNFAAIYKASGGQLGGNQNAAALYSTMNSLKDVTVQTATAMRTLERRFAISADTSATVAQNMRYVMGESEKASNEIGLFVGQLAVAMKIQPQKMMKQLANLSSDVVGYFGKTTKHLIKSLVFAKKLNLTMEQMATTAKGLDDTQKSIEASMKLQTITGKSLDIAEVLRLHNSGDTQKAIAMMYDTYHDQILKGNRHVMNVMQQMFGLDSTTLKTAANTMKKNGTSFVNALQQSSKLTEQVTDKVTEATTAAAPLQSKAQGMERRIMNAIAKVTQPIFKILQDLIPKLQPFIVLVIGRLGEMINMLMTGLLPVFNILFDVISKLISSSSGNMNTFQSIVESIIKTVVTLINLLLPSIMSIFDVVGKLLEHAFKIAGDLLITLIDSLMPLLITISKVIESIIVPLINPIKQLITVVLNIISDLVTQLIPIINIIAQLANDIIQALIPTITVIMDLVAVVGRMLGDLVQSLIPILTPILNLVTILLGSLMPIISTLLNIVVTVLSLLDPILKIAIALINVVLKPLIPIIEVLVNLLNLVLTLIMPILNFLLFSLNGALTLIGWVIEALVKFLTFSLGGVVALIDWISSLVTKVYEFYLSVIRPVVTYITTIINGMVTMVKKIFSGGDFKANIKEAFDSFNNLIMDAFLNLIVSLWNSIRDVLNSGIKILSNIFNVFKIFLKKILPPNIFDGVMNTFIKFRDFIIGLGDWIYDKLISIPVIGSLIQNFSEAIQKKQKEQVKKEQVKKVTSTTNQTSDTSASIQYQSPSAVIFKPSNDNLNIIGSNQTMNSSSSGSGINNRPVDIHITLQLDKQVLSRALVKSAVPV